jgi:hypothetical protein
MADPRSVDRALARNGTQASFGAHIEELRSPWNSTESLRSVLQVTALDKSVGITTMIDYRNRTVVGLPTKQRNNLPGRLKRRSLLERFHRSSLRSTQHQAISREYSFPNVGCVYWRPCCGSLSHVLLPRRHGAQSPCAE